MKREPGKTWLSSKVSANRDVRSSDVLVGRALLTITGDEALARDEVDRRGAGRTTVARHFRNLPSSSSY